MKPLFKLFLSTAVLLSGLHCGVAEAAKVSKQADETAKYAVDSYTQPMVKALAKMVSYNTMAVDGLALEKNPEFNGFKQYIKQLSHALGLKYQDHGYVMLVTLGESSKRLGVITHGDVQPADRSKWSKSPYELDTTSKPGLLIARGTEDDKGAIATAMYAMKAIKDKGIKLERSIELMIYLAEESDWEPLRGFLKTWQPADMNVTIDADYPVVTAENGWSLIQLDVPEVKKLYKQPFLSQFSGGAFGSQVPEDAHAVIVNGDKALMQKLKLQALMHPQVKYSFRLNGSTLSIKAKGRATHSSSPQHGINALTYLADLLKTHSWPKTTASLTVSYINELVGTGIFAEKFGQLAYSHDFMGKLTLVPTLIKPNDNKGTNIYINLRRPVGKSAELLTQQTHQVLNQWQQKHKVKLENINIYFGEPMWVKDAPHVQPLLDIFAHFTGVKDPQPVSVRGSTNAKLLPNAVTFGPSMPNTEYTGHSEHEFISLKQIKLNLAMYTAMMIELGRVK